MVSLEETHTAVERGFGSLWYFLIFSLDVEDLAISETHYHLEEEDLSSLSEAAAIIAMPHMEGKVLQRSGDEEMT